jgi:lipoate-protein ligase A
MLTRSIRLIRRGFPDDGALDTAVSRALLQRASRGELGETFRLHVPGRVVAFGKHDTLMDGFSAAAAAASAAGFLPIERIAGGRAAVFHEETLAFSWTIPGIDPVSGIHDRFGVITQLLVGAFARLGIESKVGEVPGEYCPGAFSINLDGRRKVVGVGQRLSRRAAHVGGVVVVRDGDLVRDVLIPVYEALELAWKPATAGSLADALPTVALAAVERAILEELETIGAITESELEPATSELARALVADHRIAVAT